jgi:hypothetical protein
VRVDGAAPLSATEVRAAGVGNGLRVSWVLSGDDAAGAEDVVRYELWRSANGFSDFVQIGQTAAGVGRFDDTTVAIGEPWYYQVRTVDAAGNTASSAIVGPAVADGLADNQAPEDVTNLTAVAQYVDGTQVSIYLSWTPSADSQGDLVDQRLYISTDGGASYGNNAPDFDNGQGLALGRLTKSRQIVGLLAGQSYRFRLTTLDAIPNESAGAMVDLTPSGMPSEVLALAGTLDRDETLADGVVRIDSTLTIPAGTRLSLGPGAILKFAPGAGLDVYGTLDVVGTAASPVVMTALADDAHGGDSNGDGDATSPAAGAWNRVYFDTQADAAGSRLEHLHLLFSGSVGYSLYLRAAVPVIHSIIEQGNGNGIWTYQSAPLIQGNRIVQHSGHGILTQFDAAQILDNVIRDCDHGIYSQYATPVIDGNQVQDNAEYGVYHFDARTAPTMHGNTITGNRVALAVPFSAFPDASNVLTPNDESYMVIRGNSMSRDVRLPIWAPGSADAISTYLVENARLTVPQYLTLTIDPGVVLKFSSATGIDVNGALIAEGRLDAKIGFTSLMDDRLGGDTNGDGDATLPINGQWGHIYFTDSLIEQRSHIEHALIRYAGGSGSGGAAIYLNQADPTIEDSEISNSGGSGISVHESAPRLLGNRIWGNVYHGIDVFGAGSQPEIAFNRISTNAINGIRLAAGSAAISNNQFIGNRAAGVYNDTGVPVDATQNWWGESDGSGPYHTGSNPAGLGDAVSDHVVFSPWLTEPALAYGYSNYRAAGTETAGSLPAPALIQGTLSDEWGDAPDYTMAWDEQAVVAELTGLDPDTRYKVRLSLFNGDGTALRMSLSDGLGTLIQAPMPIPTAAPVQYEFTLPQALYADGSMQLRAVNADPAAVLRGALPELWVLEDQAEIAPPRFEAILFDDRDGSGDLSIGDEYHFRFSEALDSSLVQTGTTDANLRLPAAGGAVYGSLNQSRWSADQRTLIVTLTEGFNVVGDELVTPDGLAASNGNAAIGSRALSKLDNVAPIFDTLSWNDADGDDALSLGDSYVFGFSERMDQTAIVDGGSGANAHLRPQGGGRYGNVNQLAWSADGRQVEVWITTGFTLLGDELVVPSSFVTDVAGNRAVGTQVLLGKDSVAPEITAVAFDDADGSGTVSLGDRWRFHFSEPMRTLGLTDGTTEANRNLSPAGARYGTLNRIEWSADAMAATLWVTTGYTVAGGELVSPSASLTDRAGNPLANTALLTLTDSIAPRVRQVQAKYISPVSAVDDYELAIQFDSSMDPFSEPVLALSSSGGVDPLIPTGGTWLTTSVPNDTYSTPPILLDASMDGLLTLDVSGAADWAGNPMAPAAGVFTVELDGTPPPNPQVSVAALGCDHADLNWTGYPDPGDLAGFQVYRRDDGPFSLVDGVSFIQLIGPSARALRLAGLDFDVPYQVAIVAMDDLGNITNVVDSVPISIDRVIPAAVLPTVGPGNDPDTAVLDWSSYDSSSQCGFAGFRVYRETAPFDDVTGLTPIQTLAPETRDLHVEGLDRDSDYWFAVVGINGADEFDSSVTAVRWSDPYAGDIRTDTTIGAGEQRELAIAETMQVRDGATLTIEPGTRLYFAAGTGIEVIDGRLLALGTALDPIRLASELELNGGTPAPGDWTGIRIGAGDDGSELAHITIDHATDAVRLDAAGASVTALTARYASGAGLALDNGAILTTDAALLVQNATGALATAGSQLSIGGSVLKGNGLNADLDGTSVLTATGNWWGSPDPATIAAGVTVGVQTGVADGDYLDSEPVLTPAIELADALDQVTTRNLTLRLAGRLAEEMRISEDSSFTDVFFEPFASTTDFELSPGGGDKQIFAQLRSATGAEAEPVSVTLTYLTEGPVIQSFNLSEGQVIQRPMTVTGSATAVQGLTALELYLDNALIASTSAALLEHRWDLRAVANGIHRVKLLARDANGNFASAERNLIVDIQPPPAPRITAPADGLAVDGGTLQVQGSSEPFVAMTLRRSGFVVGTRTPGADGGFSFDNVALLEGENRFVASAADSIGQSPDSNTVTVTLDSGAPAAPLLESIVRQGLGLRLDWDYPAAGERPNRFRVYRGSEPFGTPEQATRIADDLTSLSLTDTDMGDGNHSYAVTGLDAAGNESALSNLISVDFDGTRPAFSVAFPTAMPIGVGRLEIDLAVSEPLRGEPTLTLRPAGLALPFPVPVTRIDDFNYRGHFDINAELPSGRARLQVSGTDLAGNVFTGVPAGEDLIIDTKGPIGSIALPGAEPPIQVLTETAIDLSLTLDEPMADGELPLLRFAPPTAAAVTVPLLGDGSLWNGVLTLTPDMGSGIGQFSLATVDALGNPGTSLTNTELEIYTTALPAPPPTPVDLTATARPGRSIQLDWPAIATAESYSLYRAAGDCSNAADTLVAADLTGTSHMDIAPSDGDWCYALSSLRRAAESALSAGVAVHADGTPPAAVTDLAVALDGSRVRLSWRRPTDGEMPSLYRVYRDDLLLRQLNNPAADLEYYDHPGLGGNYAYRVETVDAAGNSTSSGPVIQNLLVGAVTDLEIYARQGEVPVLTWSSADPSVTGFNVYRNGVRLNPAPLTEPAYQDLGLAGSNRFEYAVTAVNADGDQGPARTLQLLPVAIAMHANDGNALITDFFNRIQVAVTNGAAAEHLDLDLLALSVTQNGAEIFAAQDQLGVRLAAGETHTDEQSVPASGSDVDWVVTARAIQQTDDGSRVVYEHSQVFTDIAIAAPGLELTTTAVPLAGGISTLNLCVRNQGAIDISVALNRDNGKLPGDIVIDLLNAEGLVIGGTDLIATPAGAVVRNGVAYLSVPAGATRCAPVDVLVPADLEIGARIVFAATANGFVGGGFGSGPRSETSLSGRLGSGITLSPYYGNAETDRASYSDDDVVLISGQAIDRDSADPLPNTALRIGFLYEGFTWYEEVITDEHGDYSLEYSPIPGISGELTTWAAHPDVYDVLDQAHFSFTRLYVAPQTGTIRSSKNDSLRFSIEVYNPSDSPIAGFTQAFRAYRVGDDDQEIDEPSITGGFDLPTGFSVAPKARARIELTLSATADAPDAAMVEYRLVDAAGASATFEASVTLAEAVPLLTVTSPAPGYVDVGVNRGELATVPVTVKNNGLRDLEDALLHLPETLTWISTNLPQTADGHVALGTIPVGAERTFDVLIAPPADQPFGYADDQFSITGGNTDDSFEIGVYTLITSSEQGDVAFTVYNFLGQLVPDAQIRLRNNNLRQELPAVRTDAAGTVLVQDLQIGEWSWQVTAPGHSAASGTVEVIADQVVPVEPELVRSLVTIRFNVVPVPFTDRYEIKIEQTFETHVPMPVLVADPPFVEFENVEPGFEVTHIVKVSNFGLKALDEVRLEVADNGVARSEPLISYLPRLGAMQTVEVPYRVTYRGEAGDQLPGAGDCSTPDLGEFLANLNNLILGSTSSHFSQQEKVAMAAIATALTLYATQNAEGYAIDLIANTILHFTGCGSGTGGGGYGPDSGGGSGGPYRPNWDSGRGGPGCFAAGTPILMADGSRRPIETLMAGDRVRAFDGSTAAITRVKVRNSDHLRELRYRSPETGLLHRLQTTDEHQFYVLGDDAWVAAGELAVGDTLLLPDTGAAALVETWRVPAASPVYNLVVADYESYFANDVLVYQECGGRTTEQVAERLRRHLAEQAPAATVQAARDDAALEVRP